MKQRLLLTFLALQMACLWSAAAEPLRVFIRSGPKSHGPGAHDHPSFLRDWVPLLNERGAKASGADHFPTAAELEQTDVLIIHTDGGGDFKPEEKPLIDAFTKRGGGIVVIHAGSVANTPEGTDYYKALTGGSWRKGETKWLEGPMNLYFTDRDNPITKDCSNFEIEDEIYYDMDLSPDIHILAAAYTPKPSGARNEKAMKKAAELTGGGKTVSVYDIQPQVWTYSKENYRAFVSIPGHNYSNFNRPNFRALLLRGIAWAGKRANVDELCKPAELGDNLRYVEGGPTRPEKAAEKLEVHPDFNISLVASEPLVNKVMNVDWDEKGRLWVVETPEYPNGRRLQNTNPWKDAGSLYPAPGTLDGSVQKDAHLERDPQDKISWLEDTNGDGVMDKKHVFADKLELCTSFCFYKSGVIACSAPDIWFLEDTTGKGVCDKRTKLYTGLGTGDTHAVINNLRWGLDGWVYATHGYSSGHVTSPNGSKDFGVDGSGVVRFKPDGSAFEMYSSRGGNTWGLDITWDGQVFWTQPTSGTVLFHTVLPEYVLAKGKIPGTTSWKGMIEHQKSYPLMTWKEQAYVQIDQVGQFTAAAGCAIYEGGAWPKKWDYSYFTTEPTLNIVHHEFVEKDGVSYKVHKEPGREETEFIRSKDLWFRPIENRVGPDGALYVVDFYNQAVIHNDTRGPLHGPANAAVRPDRDHYFSRIWKVQHKQAKKLDVPVLDKADANQLLQAISNPSAHVRMTASRLLIDLPNPLPRRGHLWLRGEQEKDAAIMEKNFGYKSLLSLALDSTKPADSRGAALQVIGAHDSAPMLGWTALLEDGNPVIRRLAALVAEGFTYGQGDGITLNFVTNTNQGLTMRALLSDNDAQVRVAALRALASCNVPSNTTHEMARRISADTAGAIVKAWPMFGDDFEKSAATAALSRYVGDALPAILDSGDASLAKVASMLAQSISEKNDPDTIAKLVSLLADKSAKADALKIVILQGIAQQGTEGPALTPSLIEALKKLLAQPALAAATLPLVSKWDKAGALADVMKAQIASLSTTLADKAAPQPARIEAARALVGTGNTEARAKVASTLVESGVPEALQREIITSLGDSGSVGELVTAMGQLKPNLQSLAFDAILKRPESSLALLDSIAAGKLDPKTLGPANLARLRTHPNKQVARKANDLLKSADAGKNKLLATLIPEVEKPGDATKGHLIFTAACSICHQIGTEGKLVGPPLTGMGVHGPGELIVSIIDPNREVDPSFWAWNITKKNGEAMAGVIVSENSATLTLRNQTGDVEIKKDDIKTRENTRRSLMPEGLEALGAENLRDVLAFICGGADNKFRVLDLRSAYDADSRVGIFAREDSKDESVTLNKFGNVTVEGVPFFIMDPEKSATGANLIALKGGHRGAVAQSFPTAVEIPTSATAASLHFLGGVAGWGWPFGGDVIGLPAMTVNVEYADGDKESILLKNGEHFADYNGKAEVPLSDNAGEFTRRGQLRYFALNLKKKAQLKKVVLETSGNIVTPCTVAMTAGTEPAKLNGTGERKANKPQRNTKADAGKSADVTATPKEGGKGDGPLMPAAPVQWQPNKLKVLIIGGGSSHNFAKFFGGTDVDTLKAAGFSVNYTEDRDQAATELTNADVAVISVNRQFFDTPAYRKALFDRVASGKGLIMLHPGTWYGYSKWPELNAQIIGGGAKGHDKLGPFSVHVLAQDHPVMKEVPPAFDVIDELYHVNGGEPVPAGTAAIEILAETTPSQKYGRPHPSVWITKNDKARIVGIALGHDEKVHDLPAFRSILTNAVKWVGGK